ncbi:MAG TPA: S-layer homology domain-containing protein [Caldisericia bacterium]|nr:S-layer homology domain-containing protein [Caldisericia bacterium]
MKKVFTFLIILSIFLQINILLGATEVYVINTNPSGEGSFVWALEKVLENGGVIKFDIPKEDKNFNGKFWTITPRNNLPEIDKKILIDGLSQTEKYGDLNQDGPEIVLDGSYITSDYFFKFKYDNFEINGLYLKNFKFTDYIRIESVKGVVRDIKIENGDTGIHLFKASNVKIKNVSLKNLNYGVYFYYSNNNIVENLVIEKTNIGVRFYFSSNDEIKDSYFKNSQVGVRIFYNSLRNKIHDNIFENNEDGLFLRDSFYNKNDIYKNKYINNTNGIHLYYGTSSLIYENEFNKNEKGIFLEFSSSNNSIYNNNFNENSYSIKFFNGCEGNLIEENNFLNNKYTIYFEEKSNLKNRFSKNIMTGNEFNVVLNGGNNGVEKPNVLFSKIFGKSILISLNSDIDGKVEIFLSGLTKTNCEKYIGERDVKKGLNNFFIPTELDLEKKYFLINFTDNNGNTSEFSDILVSEKAPFLDLTLKKSSGGERGGKIEFISNIKNNGDEDINGVNFRIKIPNQFRDIQVLSYPKNSIYKIENNEIFIDNIFIPKNSNENIKFSFSIPETIDINSTFSLQGEIEYSPYEGLKIVEKSDEDGVDDGIPNSFIKDEETKFTITGKPIISLSTSENINTQSNSIFNLSVEIKNSGNYMDNNLILKISIPDFIDFISSDIGQYKKEEKTFYLNIDTLRENEKINLLLTLKSKTTIDDKQTKISLILSSQVVGEIKKEINVFIKGEGRENLSLRVESIDSVKIYSNLEMKIFIKNSGTKDAENKKLNIKIPQNFRLISDSSKEENYSILLDRIGVNEERKVELTFRAMDGCNTINSFEISIDNQVVKKEVKIECLKIYHHPIIGGYPDGTFKPDNFVKRAEVAAIVSNTFLLSRASDIQIPKDIKDDYWGKEFILNVISNGFMSGYPDGTFNPEGILKRSEASAIIFKILNLNQDYGNYFKDIDDKYWAKGIIGAVYKKGIISGYKDGTFKGENGITRAEFLTMLLKAIGRGGISFGNLNSFNDLNENHWAYSYIMEATTPHILINPEKVSELEIRGKIYPIFLEKQNTILMVPKLGEKISVSIPFLYEDLREVDIEVTKIGIKTP